MSQQKEHSFSFTDDGVVFVGLISYSSKDWDFTLHQPIEKRFSGGHLLYAVPAIYAVLESEQETERINGLIHVNLLPRVKKLCIEGYVSSWHDDVQ